jgi:2-C-methyl-D-erythritol 4-phosphate cytidylyltransferase
MSIAAIVAAAGRGNRLGAAVPKALVPVAGTPLVVHAVCAMREAGVDVIVVTAPTDYVNVIQALVPDARVMVGGLLRQDSVALALASLPGDVEIVLVHDAARGLAPVAVVASVVDAIRAGADAAIPVLPMTDTVKQVDGDGNVVQTLERTTLRAVQTPQGFKRSVLQRAHDEATGGEVTDDAAMVEALGLIVATVPGAPLAMKVTTAADLAVAESLLAGEVHRVG